MLCVNICIDDKKFQSTRPARGATVDAARFSLMDNDISIHAPREGRDGDRGAHDRG